ALMIVAMLGFGTYMSNNVDDLIQQFEMVQQHKSVGFLVFSLAVLRVIWRLANPTPALPQDMPGWQVRASHASHVLLYVLMFAMPAYPGAARAWGSQGAISPAAPPARTPETPRSCAAAPSRTAGSDRPHCSTYRCRTPASRRS
ncbi:MAG: cytochrome b/b6 domain-containing protein, partial [Pseudomonadota bacterium]